MPLQYLSTALDSNTAEVFQFVLSTFKFSRFLLGCFKMAAVDMEVMFAQIRSLDWKFQHSCNQILILNSRIEDAQSRFDHAITSRQSTFRYSIRLRLVTLEGIRNMFYEYASRVSERLESLQHQLAEAGPYEMEYDGEAFDSDAQTEDDN